MERKGVQNLKIYLDFEAHASSHEIISIGAVSEQGNEFYSLMRPLEELDKYTQQLTGITQEQINAAESVEVVFSRFAEWVDSLRQGEKVQYLVFGSEDRHFLNKTARKCENSKSKSSIISVKTSIVNMQGMVAKKFNRDCVGLRSVYLTMRNDINEPNTQNHNALEDANMLKWICEHLDTYEVPKDIELVKVKRVPFQQPKWEDKYNVSIRMWKGSWNHVAKEWIFPNVAAAAGSLGRNFKSKKEKFKAMNAILNAITSRQRYEGKYFALVEKN